jgi:hypothetical protein
MAEKKGMDKEKALAILRTIIGPMEPGTRKDALQSVYEFVTDAVRDHVTDLTPEQREARINELLKKRRGGTKKTGAA